MELSNRFLIVAVAICGVSGFAQPSELPTSEAERESRPERDYVATDDITYEKPYSASYEKIGDNVYIVLKGVSGEKVAISEPLDLPIPAAVPKGDFLLGTDGNSVFYSPQANSDCDVKVSNETYETRTHMVTVITTRTWCNGELIDVTVTKVMVRKPALEAPNEQ